eukprot:scaffold43480_cov75-Phaeocystis_antarctica.AAC.2
MQLCSPRTPNFVPAAMRCGAMAPDEIPFAFRRCGAMVADMITRCGAMVANMITCRCSFARLARLTFLLCTGCHALCATAPALLASHAYLCTGCHALCATARGDIAFESRRCGAMVADMITCRCSFARLARLSLYRMPWVVRDGSGDIAFESRRCGALVADMIMC